MINYIESYKVAAEISQPEAPFEEIEYHKESIKQINIASGIYKKLEK
jgi:hypothetical protein